MKKIIPMIILLSLLLGCKKQEIDFQKYFKPFSGGFVLYDLSKNEYTFYNKEICHTQFSPCSTFKILNSLISLETGVIRDENEIIKWNGKKSEYPEWNKNHDLKSAITNSVVWFYQELAKRVGEVKMKQFIDTVNYGNKDINGGITLFWLKRPESKLKISPLEQVEFLKKLHSNNLPFSRRTLSIVKDIMILKKTGQIVLRGKTGSGLSGSSPAEMKLVLGHFVGYLERSGKTYFFATTITGPGAMGPIAKEITFSILKELKLL